MSYEALQTLAKSNRWTDLEKEWLDVIGSPDAAPAPLLSVVDTVVKAGQNKLADTMGWAWLSTIKEKSSPREVLDLGRQILVHLSDGEELREEILGLYRQTHPDRPDLEAWIDRSGLKSGKSVRRALRFLDGGLQLKEGGFVIHRTDDVAGQIVRLDLTGDEVDVRTSRRTETMDLARFLDDYEPADDHDFRVLQQLRPEEIKKLLNDDPATLLIGILRGHRNKIDRDALKLMLVPRFVDTASWADWWAKFRTSVKKSPNLRIEGRSPMFVIYDEAGKTPEQEMWANFSKAEAPREWLELVEGYLRDCKQERKPADADFLNRVQKTLVERIERFTKHKEPAQAFATALVIERLAADGVAVSSDPHGKALAMLGKAKDPARMVASVQDARLWPLAVACVDQAFPDRWPEIFAELLLFAPAAQCDALAKRVEAAGRAELLPPIVDRVLAEPGRYTDALMWLWKGPAVKAELPLPTRTELLTLILGLVGPTRTSEGKAVGQSVNELRAKVRSGLSSRDCERFRELVNNLDDTMAPSVRRLVERAEGLGPNVQQDLADIVRARFAHLYLKPKVEMWDDESVLYFTPTGLKAREAELNELVNVKMRENAKAIGEAAAHGDLSENSEYKFALEERDLLRARVAKLNRELSIAKLLEPNDIPSDYVSVGQRVSLRPKTGGNSICVTILGAGDGDPTNRVYSYLTPVARQMLGKRPGDSAKVTIDGDEAEYAIEKIESVLG